MRFALISDIHLRPGDRSEDEFRACLRHVQAQKPDFLVTGGDHIYDSLWSTREEMESQWELYHRVMREECHIPVEPVIGNHDVWGWGRPISDDYPDHPERGKPTALKQLGLDSRYRTFERGGWWFIVLDSVHPATDRAYTARLDEEQHEWLEATLKAPFPLQGGEGLGREGGGSLPTVILSHIPIVSVTPYFFGDNEASGDWRVPGPWMHLDARRLRSLFLRHPKVKLCLAGHMHQFDRVEYHGVTYMVCGSVSGDIWCGPFEDCRPAYSIIDLHPNGRFSRQVKHYRRRSTRTSALPPE